MAVKGNEKESGKINGKEKEFDIIVIGGGPAGLTAAIYALRAGKSVLLTEKTGIGGQATLAHSVENYPGFKQISGADLCAAMHAQAEVYGLKTLYAEAEEIIPAATAFGRLAVAADGVNYYARAVIAATGAQARKLGIAGEAEFVGRGVSYCAACDGAFFKNKTVAVVGGGNTALSDALYLSALAKKVYIIHRRDGFRAEKILQDAVKKDKKTTLVLSAVPLKILSDGKKVTGIAVAAAGGDGSGGSGGVRELPVDGVFVAVGQEPQSGLLAGKTALDAAGFAVAGEDCRTQIPGVFVAGDVRQKALRQIVTAVSDGAAAAEGAVGYLAGV